MPYELIFFCNGCRQWIVGVNMGFELQAIVSRFVSARMHKNNAPCRFRSFWLWALWQSIEHGAWFEKGSKLMLWLQ
jgi:hypothetical protein